MQFIWERFRRESRDMGYVGVFEKPNTELIKMVLDHYTDEPSVVQTAELLAGKRRAVLDGGGQQYQQYAQKDLSAFAPEDYTGSTKIGRAYTNSLFQRLHAPILNTIYKSTHIGIDMSCSFSTMLANAFRDLDLRFFDLYVHSPQVVYEQFEEMGIGRAMVKRLVNGTVCAWPASYEEPEVGEMAEIGRMELMGSLRADLEVMVEAMRERYPGFVEMVRRKCQGEGKLEHVDGTALFYLASDMEHAVMRVVIEHLFGGTQLSDVVWKYDGIIIPMAKISGRRHEEVVRELRDVVKDKLDLEVAFKVEDLAANSFGICIAPEDLNREDGLDAYERWKVCFERKFAVLEDPPVFMMFTCGGNSWTDLNKEGFNHVTMTQPKDFIKQWMVDPNQRRYMRRICAPPPVFCPENYYNTFRGIAAADLPEVDGEVDISLYLKHVDVLVGNLNGEHPDYAEYLHNLLALKFQQPGGKWRVMPVILSAQGVGKDIWFDFLASLFGEWNCIKGDGISDFVEKKSGKLEGKIMVCFQEMGTRKADREYEEQLKTYITNNKVGFERKHVNEVIGDNVFDIIGFSNKLDAVITSADDRRFFIVAADSTYMQDPDYMYPLLAFFNDDRCKRAVYDFYMSRDVSGFDSSAERPKTEAHQEMKESQASPVELFLKTAMRTFIDGWRLQDESVPQSKRDYLMMEGGVLRVKASIVIDQWMDYAKANAFAKHESRNSMVQFLGKLVREMVLRSDRFKSAGVPRLVDRRQFAKGVKGYFFDHRGIQRYLDDLFNEGDDDNEEEPASKRHRGELTARHNPNRNPKYQVLESGEVVFESNDLEQINRALGEAFICPLRGILVHQHRDNMEIDISDIWTGENKWARVEQKFPFYVRDRTA